MRHMKVWFPEFFTEAHRKPGEGEVLVEELRKFGIDCQLEPTEDCSFIFCGTLWKFGLVQEWRKKCAIIPTIHYNWDLYPFQLMELTGEYIRSDPHLWDPYVEELKSCRDIWVPSYCTTLRTREFTNRDSCVIKTSIRPWEYEKVTTGDYAVDVVRYYPDYNSHLTPQSCAAVSVPLVESRNTLPWVEFQHVISNCRFMISGQFEASTGGLTLLEGYWHGKPSLISNSPRHGGVDYLGDRATYFQWDNPLLFRLAIQKMMDNTPVVCIDEAREWITSEYSEYAMAGRMAKRFWELYDEQN